MKPAAPGTPATSRVCPHCGGSGTIVEIDPAALVMAIADVVGPMAFTVAELLAAAVDDEALAAALGGLPAKRLGKRLQRIAGKEIGGLVIERIGDEHGAAIWRVFRGE